MVDTGKEADDSRFSVEVEVGAAGAGALATLPATNRLLPHPLQNRALLAIAVLHFAQY